MTKFEPEFEDHGLDSRISDLQRFSVIFMIPEKLFTMISSTRAQLQNFFQRLRTGDSLNAKASRGSILLGASTSLDRALRLLRNMVLTRLLAPEAFGVMAIVLAINLAFESFTEVGIKKAIIQNPRGHEQGFLNGAWWFSLTRGVMLYLLAFGGASWIAHFYDNPNLVSLMRVAFLSILFNGAMSPKAHVAIKQMNFGRWVVISQGSAIIGISTTIVLALITGNVWALVIGFVFEAVARSILSFFLCPYRPGLTFERDSLHGLFRFTRGMIGLPILTFIFMRADIFVIGKLCSSLELGLYSMAFALAQIPLQTVISVMNQIILPVFSKKQNERDWINQAVLDITSAIAYFCFPILVFVILYGKNLLTFVYGGEYAQVALPFAIIFASSMLRTCGIPIVQVYWSMGRPELHRIFTGIRALLIIILIIPFVKWFGLTGAATASLISIVVAYLFQVIGIHKLTKLKLQQYALIFFRASGISLCVIMVWLAIHYLSPFQSFFNLFTGAISCLLAYGLAIWFFFKYRNKSPILLCSSGK